MQKNEKKNPNARRIPPRGNENAMRRRCGRILLGDNRRRCGHAAADQIPVWRILDFTWSPLYNYSWPCV